MTKLQLFLRKSLTLALWGVLSGQLAAATLTVSGVILDEQGQRAGGATVVLCYVESVPLRTKDTSSRSGVYSLVRLNVDVDLPKAFSIALGDSKYEDSKAEVDLFAANDLLLGKAEDIIRKRRLPVAFSYPFLKKEEVVNRLKNLEETQSLLVKNGWRDEQEAREVWAKEAAKIMANLDDAGAEPREILREAKEKVNPKIVPDTIIPEDLRAGLLEGKSYQMLKAERLDPAGYLKTADKRVPDEVVDFMLHLPPEKIRLDWLPEDAAKNALVKRMGNGSGPRVIGVLPFNKGHTPKLDFPSLIEVKESSLDASLKAWTRNPDVRQSILLDFLSTDGNRLSVTKLEEIQRTYRANPLHSFPVVQ